MFAYCLNNPVNMSDEYGCMPGNLYMADGGGNVKKPNPKPPTPNKSNGDSGFNPGASAVKGVKSSSFDKVGEVVSVSLIKGKLTWQSFETLTLGTYVSKFSKGAVTAKNVLGLVGTIGFTAWDCGSDISKGQYVGAAIDLAGALLGIGVGIGIGAFTGIIVTASTPIWLAAAVGIAGVGIGIGVGVLIDKVTSGIKDVYYGG